MIIQCSDCQTRFQLDPDRVPRRQIRVRCSRCRYVFSVDGRMIDEAPGDAARVSTSGSSAPVSPSESGSAPAAFSGRSTPVDSTADDSGTSPGIGLEVERPSVEGFETAYAAAESRSEEQPSAATATLEQDEVSEAPPTPDEVEIEPTPQKTTAVEGGADADPKTKKARRLARALVSDILVYNRELRDRSLAEGNLVQALGPEIKKSWELYKEKVDPEFAKESDFFRAALNDILADGQKIF